MAKIFDSILVEDTSRYTGTVEWDKGGDIASAAALALGTDGNYFDVTGILAITSVSAKPIGTRILLQFDGVVTVTHNATTLILKDGANFVTVATNHLELISYDGTNWAEIGRSSAVGATDADAIHDNVAAEISLITEKTVLANADLFVIEDSAAANAKKRVTRRNVIGERSKSITIEDPSATEDIQIYFTNKAITINEIRTVVRGSTPSVTWTIRHGTDRSATGAEVVTSGTTTTSQTTGDDVTTFNDATVIADSFVWLETTAQSGTVDEISITIFYTED